MSVMCVLKLVWQKYKNIDSYKKRSVIYITIAVLFMIYEFIFHRPPRVPVLLLWFGVIIIAIFVMSTLRDPRR